MTHKPKTRSPRTDYEQSRELRDAYLDVWAKATVETVNSEAYAQASGAMLETYLATSSPFRTPRKN